MVSLLAAGLIELKFEEYGAPLHYIAPEILNGSGALSKEARSGAISKEADVFSFAMVMVEVRLGFFPWTAVC